MGKHEHQSIIELNGQRFNARTGVIIEGVVKTPVTPLRPLTPTMRDIARQPRAPRSTTASKQLHRAQESSKTLIRYAVKKPSTITNRKTIAMDVVPQTPGLATVQAFHAVNPERGHRADVVRQNSKVSRFGGSVRDAWVTPKPQASALDTAAPQAVRVDPAATLLSHTNTYATSAMLENGLRNANSHQAIPSKKATKIHHRIGKKIGLSARAASIAAGSMAVLLIGGILAYQNIPNISVRYASTKAGINASLPTYQPSGFAINNHINYRPGEISVAYKANADNRAYVLTQKSTNWNSDALKEHIMGTTGIIPQIYPDNGRTIYLHDNHEADWVNDGVWYSITGNSNLNTDQLIKIATSL